jgi:hypothetical protein
MLTAVLERMNCVLSQITAALFGNETKTVPLNVVLS